MNYGLWRVKLYHDALRQWLENLQQIGFGLVVLFPMALPVLVFLPLLSLGVAANPQTTPLVYLNTIWGYLLLLFSWMTLQRDGICGTRYQLYLNSLPTPRWLKATTDAGLLLYGAHFFILGPLGLLAIVLFEQRDRLLADGAGTLWLELVPLAGLLVLAIAYSWLALRGKIPWLSLLLFPFLAFLWAEALTKPQWLMLWSVVILLEYRLPALSLQLGRWPQGLFRLLWQADLHAPSADSLRLVALLLLIALTRVCLAAVNADFAPFLLNTVSFLSAVLIGYSLFAAQAFRQKYQLYLVTLPQSANNQAIQALGYVLAKSTLGLLLILVSGVFTPAQLGLWLLFYSATLLGIWLKPKLFLLFPVSVVMGLVLVNAVTF
jgi:hypothetical protein